MTRKDVVVKNSGIEGKGVFARRDFKEGDVVIQWDISHILTQKEVVALSKNKRRYVAHVAGKNILMQSPARYVNHSCEANTEVRSFCDVAKRNIKKGEEITGNYAEVEVPGFEMSCRCGSRRCKKNIKVF